MLGLRLDSAMERRLAQFARQTRRSKSDIARDAMREYLDRHAGDDEYQRQVRAIAALRVAAGSVEADFAEFEALASEALAGEPDYDWGERPQ